MTRQLAGRFQGCRDAGLGVLLHGALASAADQEGGR